MAKFRRIFISSLNLSWNFIYTQAELFFGSNPDSSFIAVSGDVFSHAWILWFMCSISLISLLFEIHVSVQTVPILMLFYLKDLVANLLKCGFLKKCVSGNFVSNSGAGNYVVIYGWIQLTSWGAIPLLSVDWTPLANWCFYSTVSSKHAGAKFIMYAGAKFDCKVHN